MANVQGPRKNTTGGQQAVIELNPQSLLDRLTAPTIYQNAEQSTLWIQPRNVAGTFLGNAFMNLGKNGAGNAVWGQLLFSGGAGSFSSLTVTGPTNVNISGSAVTNIGTGTYTGVVTIGNTAGGVVNLVSPIVDIDSSLAGVMTFGDSVTTGSITMGSGLTTGTFNIGNHASTNTLNLKSGTGGTNVVSGGLFAVDFLSDIHASPTATAVINGRQCYATFTGFTTAAAASQVFIITNSLITAGSSILVSANNLGSNDAQMTVTRVLPGAGTVSITLKNNGAAALNGDVNLTMWVMD